MSILTDTGFPPTFLNRYVLSELAYHGLVADSDLVNPTPMVPAQFPTNIEDLYNDSIVIRQTESPLLVVYDRQGYGLFDDFYITGILGYTEKDSYLNKMYESVENNKVTCDECGWSWDLSDGGNDPYTCHKCGHENKNPHD